MKYESGYKAAKSASFSNISHSDRKLYNKCGLREQLYEQLAIQHGNIPDEVCNSEESSRCLWLGCLSLGMRPLSCWDCGFESLRLVEFFLLYVFYVVRYRRLYRADRSLQRSRAKGDVSECDRKASIMRRLCPNRSCCTMGRKCNKV
jgi:hypothetical protein